MNIGKYIEKYDELVNNGAIPATDADEAYSIEAMGGANIDFVYNAYRYGFIKGMLQVHNDNWINEKAAKG